MILGAVIALVAAAAYGVSDWLGGTAAIRLRVLVTTVLSYTAATVVLVIAAPLSGGAWSSGALLWGSLAGASAVVGFVTFYAAMAAGPMSLVSPLIAVLGSAVPVVAAVMLGETLPPLAWLGILLAIASAVLVSVQPRNGARRMTTRTGILTAVSGTTLGLSLVALDLAPVESSILPALMELAVGLAILLIAFAASQASGGIRRFFDGLSGDHAGLVAPTRPRALAAALVGGGLLGVANALIVVALQAGSLAVVSVLVGLYPVATLLLARIVSGERTSLMQRAGVVLALAASTLLGLSISAGMP